MWHVGVDFTACKHHPVKYKDENTREEGNHLWMLPYETGLFRGHKRKAARRGVDFSSIRVIVEVLYAYTIELSDTDVRRHNSPAFFKVCFTSTGRSA